MINTFLFVVWLALIFLMAFASKAPAEITIHTSNNLVTVEVGLNGEFSIPVATDTRYVGGNEKSFGDFFINPTVDISLEQMDGKVGFVIDWVPEDSVLNFGDMEARNFHNENRLRADGFLSRPNLLSYAYYERGEFTFKLGADRFSGISPLNSPTSYYAANLSPLVLSEHYDKGAKIEYKNSFLFASVGMVDGDWDVGQPSVFSYSDSRANSYPGGTGELKLNLYGFEAQVSILLNTMGSNPGQKTYLNTSIAALGYRGEISSAVVSARIFNAKFGRGPTWDAQNKTVSPEETGAYGAEISVKSGKLTLYGGWSEMKRSNTDGALRSGCNVIWVDKTTTYEKQWVASSSYAVSKNLSLLVSFGNRQLNGAEAWGIAKPHTTTAVIGVGVKF